MSATSISSVDRIGLALFFGVSLHALIILGISFAPPLPKEPEKTPKVDLIIVENLRQPQENDNPDFLAQVSQQGSGNVEEKVKPKSQQSLPTQQASAEAASETQTAAPEPPPKPKAREVLTQTESRTNVDTQKPAPPKPKQRKKTLNDLLASKDREIARVTAELNQKTQAYAKRPRRKSISASTQEYKYASYLEAWRKKVERIGNINYPDSARRNQLSGNLVLHVAVRADGTIERVQLLHSSGHKTLDDAAIRIVRLSAPFAPFPNEIRKEVDILDITRTWRFTNRNTVSTSN